MEQALELALEGLKAGEVPVACVFQYENQTIAKAHNLTNVSRVAIDHCELLCLNYMYGNREDIQNQFQNTLENIINQCTLYVTVEPCIMCAAALRIAGIQKVIFGCRNQKFGGNGSICNLSLQENFPIYEVVGGQMEEKAIQLLQSFYERGNLKVPENKRKRRK